MKIETKYSSKAKIKLNVISLSLFVIMLIIPITFFVLLNQQQSTGFGFREIIISIVFALVITYFLLWVKSYMKTRPYLGLIIGLLVLGAFEYSLFLKFRGSYTVLFAIIAAIVTLIYFGIYFFKYRAAHIEPEGFDDKLTPHGR